MHRNLYPFLFLICAFFLFGCEKEEVPAKATIVIDKQIVKVGEEVTIKSVGGNPIYHKWDFGIHQPSGNPENKVIYKFPGRYIVRLTTIDFQNNTHETAAVVIVGEPHINGLMLSNFNFLDPDGKPWNTDGSDPVIGFQITGLVGRYAIWSTGGILLSQSKLPYSTDTGAELKTGNNNLSVQIFKFDYPTNNQKIIFKQSVNPQALLLNPAYSYWLPIGTNYPNIALSFYFK